MIDIIQKMSYNIDTGQGEAKEEKGDLRTQGKSGTGLAERETSRVTRREKPPAALPLRRMKEASTTDTDRRATQ